MHLKTFAKSIRNDLEHNLLNSRLFLWMAAGPNKLTEALFNFPNFVNSLKRHWFPHRSPSCLGARPYIVISYAAYCLLPNVHSGLHTARGAWGRPPRGHSRRRGARGRPPRGPTGGGARTALGHSRRRRPCGALGGHRLDGDIDLGGDTSRCYIKLQQFIQSPKTLY